MLFKLGVTSGTQGFAVMEIEMSKIAKVGILDVSLNGWSPGGGWHYWEVVET